MIFDFSFDYKKMKVQLCSYTVLCLLSKQKPTLKPSGHHVFGPNVMHPKKIKGSKSYNTKIQFLQIVRYVKYFLGIFNIRVAYILLFHGLFILQSTIQQLSILYNNIDLPVYTPTKSRACSRVLTPSTMFFFASKTKK